MKKGFTLIELLAVIAILAILVVVAVPTVLKLFKEANLNTFKVEAQNIVNAAEQGYGSSLIKKRNIESTTFVYEDGELTSQTGNIDLYLSGKKIQDGIIKIKQNGKVLLAIQNGKYCAITKNNSKEIIVNEEIKNCETPVFLEWNKSYDGSSGDIFNGITEISNGFIVVGNSSSTNGDLSGLNNKGSSDAIIVRYDLDGNIVWQKNYGGSGADNFTSIVATTDGFIAVGNSNSTEGDLSGLSKGSDDGIIVKYDLDGNIVWRKNYGGSGTDYFKKVITITDGFIVVGESSSTNGDLSSLNKGGYDAIIVKYDLNGNVVWRKNLGGSSNDTFNSLIATASNLIAVGYSASTNGDLSGLNKGSSDAIIVKYDLSGNIVWKKNYGGNNGDFFRGIGATADGFIAAGYSNSATGDLLGLSKGSDDAIIVKYDVSGNVIWKKNYGGSGYDYFYELNVLTDNLITVGYSSSTDGDSINLNKGSVDSIIAKYDLNGNVIWKKNYGGSGFDAFYGMTITDDSFIGVGYSYSTDGDLEGLNQGGTAATIFNISN